MLLFVSFNKYLSDEQGHVSAKRGKILILYPRLSKKDIFKTKNKSYFVWKVFNPFFWGG